MKQCPVCNAVCFDDMEVCYGCLHTFGSKKDSGPALRVQSRQAEDAVQKTPAAKTCARLQQASCDCDIIDIDDDVEEQKSKPAHARPDLDFIPQVVVESVDKCEGKIAAVNETWSLKLSIPAECQGVTLRLERG